VFVFLMLSLSLYIEQALPIRRRAVQFPAPPSTQPPLLDATPDERLVWPTTGVIGSSKASGAGQWPRSSACSDGALQLQEN